MGERWLPVVGYEGIYEISDLGRVRSLDRFDAAGFWRRGQMRRQSNVDGYRVVKFCRDGVQTMMRVHRLVLEAFVGPCPPGMQACHFPDRNRSNNRLSNLRWDTGKANLRDRIDHGTDPTGERNPRAKLTETDVLAARRWRREGMRFEAIGKRLGISCGHARKVVVGENWGHV